MVLPSLIENLMSFNLTRQEAIIYIEFLTHGAMSGYEVSKETGISRSNVYSALQSLTEKGALYLVEGESTKYIPVPVKEFLTYWIRELKEKALQIEATDGNIDKEAQKELHRLCELYEKKDLKYMRRKLKL